MNLIPLGWQSLLGLSIKYPFYIDRKIHCFPLVRDMIIQRTCTNPTVVFLGVLISYITSFCLVLLIFSAVIFLYFFNLYVYCSDFYVAKRFFFVQSIWYFGCFFYLNRCVLLQLKNFSFLILLKIFSSFQMIIFYSNHWQLLFSHILQNSSLCITMKL